jgi:hypothetical protein
MTCCTYSCTQYSLHTQYMLLTTCCAYSCTQYTLPTAAHIFFRICLALAYWKKNPNFLFMNFTIFPSLSCTSVQRTPLTNCVFLTTNADSAVTTDWAPQEFALCHYLCCTGGARLTVGSLTVCQSLQPQWRLVMFFAGKKWYNFNTRILNRRLPTEQCILSPFSGPPPPAPILYNK